MKLMERERQKEKHPLGNVFEKTSEFICETPDIKIISYPYNFLSAFPVKFSFDYSPLHSQGAVFVLFHPPAFIDIS